MNWRTWLIYLALALMFAVAFLGPLFVTRAFASCRTHKCWHRVSVKRHVAYAWRWYRAHPMPRCTWVPESGAVRAHYSEYGRSRYRARNPQSTAGGKFQILDGTFHAYGGPDYPGTYDAAQAPPLLQENIARRIRDGQGLGAWVEC